MIWALLAVLGVPIWLIVGVLGAAAWSRRSFARQPGVVSAKLRDPGVESWPRRRVHVRVVHDVLVVNSGLARVRTSFHGVRAARVDEVPSDSVRGIQSPVVLVLDLDDGTRERLATEAPLHPDLASLVRAAHRPGQGPRRHAGEGR